MSVQFKKYKHVKNENFDEFLQACGKFGRPLVIFRIIRSSTDLVPLIPTKHYSSGVGFMIRKMATSVSSTVQLVKTGDNSYCFNTSSTFRKTQLAFVLNEEFIEVRLSLIFKYSFIYLSNFLGLYGWL